MGLWYGSAAARYPALSLSPLLAPPPLHSTHSQPSPPPPPAPPLRAAGYQIAGIGNRTTIADGNTWNHEHIATLGRCLTAPEKHAHRIIRHLADYVLLWTGGGARGPVG